MAEPGWSVAHGDCLDVMRTLDDDSVDAGCEVVIVQAGGWT